MNEFNKYAITGMVGSQSCKELTKISHVTHIDYAYNILREKSIKKRFIYDESKLTKKIEVVWLSCNDWGSNGYMYGTVRFSFDFRKLVGGKKFYWVEDISKYNPTACRILITSNDYPNLEEYDIKEAKGPISYCAADDKYYWNGNYTLELMFDNNISIDENTKIDFVKHHSSLCCLKKVKCNEQGIDEEKSSARLFAKIIREKLNIVGFDFLKDNSNFFINHSDLAINTICSKISCNPSGNIESKHDAASDIMNAILEEFYRGNEKSCQRLALMYKTVDDFWDTFRKHRAIVFNRKIEVKGISNKKYIFKAIPIFAQLNSKFIYIFCKIRPENQWVDYYFISETDKFSQSIYDNAGAANCILVLVNEDDEERKNIVLDIFECKKYKLKN